MKRNRRHLPIPQHEFGFSPQAFNLFAETTLDGERVARERAAASRGIVVMSVLQHRIQHLNRIQHLSFVHF